MVSRAGNPQACNSQASPADSTLSQAESTVSQAFLADSSLPQGESMAPRQATPRLPQQSEISQAGNHQAAPTVRCSARLRASHASPNNNSQAVSSQAGNSPLADSTISQQDSEASQVGSSQAGTSLMTSSTSPLEAGSSPFPIGQTTPRVLPPRMNLTQSGS